MGPIRGTVPSLVYWHGPVVRRENWVDVGACTKLPNTEIFITYMMLHTLACSACFLHIHMLHMLRDLRSIVEIQISLVITHHIFFGHNFFTLMPITVSLQTPQVLAESVGLVLGLGLVRADR